MTRGESSFLSVALISVRAGWLTKGHPDPAGVRIKLLRDVLLKNQHIKALFWE